MACKCTTRARVGAFIKHRRTRRNMSQTDMAKRLGLSRGFLSDLERGKRGLSLQTFVRLCQLLRVMPGAFIR
jgi:transcriptional regulator with XRE-family HTH domain